MQVADGSIEGEMMDIMTRDLGSHRKLTQMEPQLADATRNHQDLQKQYNELLQAFEELKTQPRNNIEVSPFSLGHDRSCSCLLF